MVENDRWHEALHMLLTLERHSIGCEASEAHDAHRKTQKQRESILQAMGERRSLKCAHVADQVAGCVAGTKITRDY